MLKRSLFWTVFSLSYTFTPKAYAGEVETSVLKQNFKFSSQRFDDNAWYINIKTQHNCKWRREWLWGLFESKGKCSEWLNIADLENEQKFTLRPLEDLHLGFVPMSHNKVKSKDHQDSYAIKLNNLLEEIPFTNGSDSEVMISYEHLIGPLLDYLSQNSDSYDTPISWSVDIQSNKNRTQQVSISDVAPQEIIKSSCKKLSSVDFKETLVQSIDKKPRFHPVIAKKVYEECEGLPLLDIYCHDLFTSSLREDASSFDSKFDFCINQNNPDKKWYSKQVSQFVIDYNDNPFAKYEYKLVVVEENAKKLISLLKEKKLRKERTAFFQVFVKDFESYLSQENLDSFIKGKESSFGNKGALSKHEIVSYVNADKLWKDMASEYILDSKDIIHPMWGLVESLSKEGGVSSKSAKRKYGAAIYELLQNRLKNTNSNIEKMIRIAKVLEGYQKFVSSSKRTKIKSTLKSQFNVLLREQFNTPREAEKITRAIFDYPKGFGFIDNSSLYKKLRKAFVDALSVSYYESSSSTYLLPNLKFLLGSKWVEEQTKEYEELIQKKQRELAESREREERLRKEKRRAALARAKDDAFGCAKTVISNYLKSPGSARWYSERILYSQHPHYLVHIVVDSQNGFGAYLRNSLCVAVTLGEGDKFTWYRYPGVQECSNPPRDYEVELLKRLHKVF